MATSQFYMNRHHRTIVYLSMSKFYKKLKVLEALGVAEDVPGMHYNKPDISY